MAVPISIVPKNRDQWNHHTIRSIRESSLDLKGRPRGEVTVDCPTLKAREAFERFRQKLERGEGIDFGILVMLDFPPEEIEVLRADCEKAQIEIICFRLGWGRGDEGKPLADLNTTLTFGDEAHIGEAVRKSWLRGRLRKQGVSIRPIRADRRELRSYFALRYKVYQPEGYVPQEYDSPNTGLEIDYADRWSFPVGAFSKDGRLIGCIRLVEEYGKDNEYKDIIEGIVLDARDEALTRAWELRYLPYPFDLCQHFSEQRFQEYYSELVRRKLNKAEIGRVIVRPGLHRGQGLGEVLVDTMISMARQRTIQLLLLACKDQHKALYMRSGFHEIPNLVCEQFGRYKVRAIAMERPL
jgi:predicted GNAT family N-acyltransferase